MRRAHLHAEGLGIALSIALGMGTATARADDAPPATWSTAPAGSSTSTATGAAPAPPATVVASPPPAAASGVAVVARAGAADAAWPLAQAVYASPALRPPAMDDARARVLCGEAPPAGAGQDLSDLADMVAALRGDDAPTRAVLGEVTRRLGLRALVLVGVADGRATARVFVADGAAFDAATYAPDPGSSSAWSGTVRSLLRAFGSPPPATAEEVARPTSAPTLALHEATAAHPPEAAGTTKAPPKEGRAFYQSGWFWAALGAAAFGAGAVFLATQDSKPSTIHLELQVPR